MKKALKFVLKFIINYLFSSQARYCMNRSLFGRKSPLQEDSPETTLKHIQAAIDWILRAQEIQPDGGVSAYIIYGGREIIGTSYPEVTGYIIFTVLVLLGQFDRPFAILFFLLAVVFGIILSLLAVLLEEYSTRRYPRLRDIIIIIAYGLLENVLYRQWLAVIRAMAFLDIAKRKEDWGEMKKKGFSMEG